jgi:anti-sigma regulatory factor (Ser/Thr protein kinase)
MSLIAVELPSTTDAANEARSVIRERMADRLPATLLWDLLTVVSELVTNAVRHGGGDTVRISLDVAADGRVSGDVENDGRGRVEPLPIEPASATGMGLHIVGAVADRWWVRVGDATRVSFELVAP